MQELGIKKDWIKVGLLDFQLKQHYEFNTAIINQAGGGKLIPYPYGGMFLRLHRSAKNYISVINNSGFPVFQKVMLKIDDIHSIFWWFDGNIGVLHYDSTVSVVSTFGQVIRRYEPPEHLTICCAKEFNFGIAFVNEKKNIYVFNSENDNFYPYGNLSQNSFPTLIDYSAKPDKGIIVTESNEVFAFNATDVTRIWTAPTAPSQIKLHYSGKAVACINDTGLYIVQTAAAGTVTLPAAGIVDFAWIDENTVILATQTQTVALQLGFNSPIPIPVSNVQLLADDEDGVRIYGSDVYTLTPIPKSVQQLLLPTNAHRVSLLIQAYQSYLDNDITCYAILEENNQILQQTVEKIIAAAPYIMNADAVERLLTAAAFAKYQIHNFNHEEFANTIKVVRMLFSLRRPQEANEIDRTGYSFLTTGTMYELANKDSFVSYCANLRLFDLAEAMAKIVGKSDTSDIAMAWAMFVLAKDPYRVDFVLQRIEPYKNIDYQRLSLFAREVGSDPQSICSIIRRIRDPVIRIRSLQNPAYENQLVPSLNELKDGDAFIRYFFRVRFTSVTDKTKFNFLNSSQMVLDQVVAFQRFINTSLLENCALSSNRLAELTMIHTTPPDLFGRTPTQLEVCMKYFPKEKHSPFGDAIRNQIAVDEMLVGLPSGPADINGTGPAPSPRQIMERALVTENEKLFNKVTKQYQLDDKFINFTKLKTYIKYEALRGKIDGFVQSVSTKMPLGIMADLLFEANLEKQGAALVERIPNKEEKLQKLMDRKLYARAADVANKMGNTALAEDLQKKAKENQK